MIVGAKTYKDFRDRSRIVNKIRNEFRGKVKITDTGKVIVYEHYCSPTRDFDAYNGH